MLMRIKRGKRLSDFRFGTSVGRFSSNGLAVMAVKGLTLPGHLRTVGEEKEEKY